MPPSELFCELLWHNGIQVIFAERPGFGTSSPMPEALLSRDLIETGATATAEAVLVLQLIRELQLKQVILLGMGSANPVCYRASLMSSNIVFSLYSNVVFNKDILGVFKPKWLQEMLRLMVHSQAGVKMATAGIKNRLKHNPLELYRLLVHQSPGDLHYIQENQPDFIAAGDLLRSVDWAVIDYDVRTSLKSDPFLKNGLFSGLKAVAFSGIETPDHWQAQLNHEAQRLSIPVAYAPYGDFFAPYASPHYLLSLIQQHTDPKVETP